MNDRSWSGEDFDRLYADSDPFGYDVRWYEQRKRALVLASIPAPRIKRAWEMGCSNGALSACLAERCDRLIATDISPRAIELARQRTRDMPWVSAQVADHPDDWPVGQFELIVISEVGYYFGTSELPALWQRVERSLAPGGYVLLCHWLPAVPRAQLDGRQVHAIFARSTALQRLFAYEDADFMLEGWSADARSLGTKEGLR